jgi:hypothetical protein
MRQRELRKLLLAKYKPIKLTGNSLELHTLNIAVMTIL